MPATRADETTRLIALLRAINLGSRNRVPMADLRALTEDLGHREVRTYVQSGNLVFTADCGSPSRVGGELERRLAATFGFAIPVVIRTRDELARVVRENPLGDVATDPARHTVAFLAEEVDPERLADLDPEELAPEAFAMRGREIHMWSPGGTQNSPLAKAMSEKRLGVVATVRNWRTVEKLLALADETA